MKDVTDHMEYKIAVILWKSFPPICLVIGTFGNVLTIIILMQRKSRQSSTAMYLTALAASDLLALWTGLSRTWPNYIFGTDLVAMSAVWCKLQVFLVYTGFQCSSWFLVAVTSERFIGVWFPHKVKLFCNTRNSCITILVITGFLMILNTHWFYGYITFSYSINNDTDELYCGNIDDDNYVDFIEKWDWIDLCLVSFVPTTLLLIANSSIIFFIIKRRKAMLTSIAPLNSTTGTTGHKVSQMTFSLVAVNIVFVVCSTPISVYIIKQPQADAETSQDVAIVELWWAVVNCLAYLNTTLNFVLYFLSGTKFRKQVKTFFRLDRSTTTSANN